MGTTSDFLGERYDRMLRSWVAMLFISFYALMYCPQCLYSGALSMQDISGYTDEDVHIRWITTAIGGLGAIYAIGGGLKGVAISDCLNGIGLLVAGFAVPLLAISKLPNGFSDVFSHADKLQVWTGTCNVLDEETWTRSPDTPGMPWHVIPLGVMLNNMYYWGTNQVIVQRALAAESPAQGQKGVLFAACIKVVGFAVLLLPGLLGQLFQELRILDQNGLPFDVAPKADLVYPRLVNAVLPTWSRGIFLGVLLGSVLSSFNSALNSASTMFSLEIYKVYISPASTHQRTVRIANIFGVCLTLVSFILAPEMRRAPSILVALQKASTIVGLPILSIFFVGIFSKLPDALAGKTGFVVGLLSILVMQPLTDDFPFYSGDAPAFATISHYHIFELAFLLAMQVIIIMTYWPGLRSLLGGAPRPTPFVEKENQALVDMTPWQAMPMVIVSLCAALTLLLASLQIASEAGFYLFGALWFLSCCALVFAPVPEPERTGKAAASMLLSVSTNTFDRAIVLSAGRREAEAAGGASGTELVA